jgi:hypothetical protein
MASEKSSRTRRHLVTLADLAPRQEITGGSDRCVFGSNPVRSDEGSTAMKNITPARAAKPKVKGQDLPPKSPAKVKGGGVYLNDNITLVRAAKPTATGKDLTPKSPSKVRGGVRKSGGCQQDY